MGMTPEQGQVWALRQQGFTRSEIAAQTGLTREAVKSRLRRARQWADAPEGVKAAATATGLDLSSLTHGWIKTGPNEDGVAFSGAFRNKTSPEDMAEAIKAAMADMPALPPVTPPQHCASDLLTLYPIADAHVGMLSWVGDTGEPYNTARAARRLMDWMGQAVDASPASGTAIILDVGDLLHADDQTNQTPRSKHALDVDTRHYRTVDMTITAMCSAIEYAAQKHERVVVCILRGNHDETAYLAVLFALRERYRDNPRIEVRDKPGEFFVHQFGRVMLAAHHGDRAKADRLVHFMADEFAAIWGRTQFRHLWTGHLHHHKSQDIGGVVWEQLRALTARDAYAYNHAYTARAQLSAVTYHRERGEVFRARVAA